MAAKKLDICQKEWVIASLWTNMENIMQKLWEIKEELKEFRNNFEDFVDKYEQEKKEIIAQLTKYSNNNFASKWTEKILIFIWWVIWTTLIWAFISLILK